MALSLTRLNALRGPNDDSSSLTCWKVAMTMPARGENEKKNRKPCYFMLTFDHTITPLSMQLFWTSVD